MRRLILLLPLLLLLLLTGCLSEEEQLVGKWRGKVELGSAIKSSPMGMVAGGYANMIEPQLDLRPDKTFALSFSMAPIEGTWTLKDQEITLTPKSVMGMSAGQAQQRMQKALDHAPAGLPIPIAGMLPDTKQLHVQVVGKGQRLVLDPGSGTLFAAFGKMTFTKV